MVQTHIPISLLFDRQFLYDSYDPVAKQEEEVMRMLRSHGMSEEHGLAAFRVSSHNVMEKTVLSWKKCNVS